MEGAINEIRSIAFSMASLTAGEPIQYQVGAEWLRENWDMLTALELPKLSFLNINVPNQTPMGHRFAAMGRRVYKDRVEMREDPWGNPYYWQGGVVITDHAQPETDVDAIRKGYVSITPVSLDWTDRDSLTRYQGV